MKKPIKISKEEPELKSMNYSRLRELGIAHIQELAGELWTDYNTHDPGITILEVLCYAITDLGNRANQNIENILQGDPSDPGSMEIRNFFTAAEILPNKPVTIADLRQIIIDVIVEDESDTGCDFVGVKNAWINISDESEVPVWANLSKSKLSYEKKKEKEQIDFRTLYSVLLEFERCETHGDLNEHIVRKTMTVTDEVSSLLKGMEIRVEMELPRWDEEIDWSDASEIRMKAENPKIQVANRPPGINVGDEADDDKIINLNVTGPGTAESDLSVLTEKLNEFVDEMAVAYQKRVKKVHRIVEKVVERLHDNRNLCEDFYRIHALKIEGIAICADIELELEANVEEVQAQIYHQIAQFLAPPVNVYSLAKMVEKGVPTEKIFEGPLLNHGLIDEEELMRSERREVIYVSDLVQIIMDIDGVMAVKEIEIANIPQGNEENIPSKSVKWCLDLAHKYNYVPRLSISDSKITFFKEQLPYQASLRAVEVRLKELAERTRSKKLRNPKLDLEIPEGRYQNLEQYRSIQNEFPAAYGVGDDGLPAGGETEKIARTKQLKGYLTFFDQLLANYMSQLEHVRKLFSMNAEKDESDQYKIGRTYFTQALDQLIPDGEQLFVNGSSYLTRLNEITESPELFAKRRNKFLDHLMARFAEQFTDYATLTYRLANMDDEEDRKDRLIRDKLTFLNAYPEISSGRGIAFNYLDRCNLWHIKNRSGLEKKAALQVGVDDQIAADLIFSDHIKITNENDTFGFEVRDSADNFLFENQDELSYDDKDAAVEAVEKLIMSGLFRENYKVYEDEGIYSFTIESDGLERGRSASDGFDNEPDLETAINALMQVFETEFYENPQANRKNITAPIENYFKIQKGVSGSTIHVDYKVYHEPFSEDPDHLISEGKMEFEAGNSDQANAELDERADEFIWNVIINGKYEERYRFEADENDPKKGVLKLYGRFGGEFGFREILKEELEKTISELARFFRNTFSGNEGLHLVEHVLLRPKQKGDTLMSIQIDPDCDHCQLSDPYSYVATVVLPYWQGRFSDMDFRTFFDRKIRYEAPAHTFLKICWVSNQQIEEFEKYYKRWLIENAREETDQPARSDALNNLIDILDRLRNVYPAGRLHDCEESDTLEDSMILNNTILGSA